MALTKTQINYLENKLNRVVEDKVDTFRKKLGEGKNSDRVIIDELVAGNIKLLSNSEIIKILKTKLTNYYYCNMSVYLNELISKQDRERIENKINQRDKKINEFRDRLDKAKANALDKIVLDGVDVETALAELNKIK